MRRAVVLAAMAACSGVVDVWAVGSLGGAFAGVVTGNLVTTGAATAAGRWGDLVAPVVAVAGFVVGVALWTFGRRRWPAAVAAPLLAELLLLVVLAVLWPSAGAPAVLLLAGAAIAMGGQSSVALRLGESSTYLMGTLTGAVADLAAGEARRWSAVRQLGALVLGAVAGGLLLVHLPGAVPALAAVPLLVAVVVQGAGEWRRT
ncbi:MULTISPECIES: DUF1275 family protein [unclassified Pseudonocardia]|uniref:DUF1275 family protein n=1 Tax=unclassified Pseudonocardia TaxID=2619320 RepID=UPI000ADB7630|nr:MULTISPECIES: DUF1275 family protein [unclassified Pseudonocardia]